MPKTKRGQTTLFIILGLVVLIAVSFIYLVKQDTLESQAISQSSFMRNTQIVETFINSCLDKVSKETLLKNNMQGGHINLPDNFKSIGAIPTSFLFFRQVGSLLTKNGIENEISGYIDKKLSECVNDFSEFSYLKIKKGKVKAQTSINEKDVTIKINWPIKIKQGGFSREISEFQTSYRITLKNMIERVNEIISDLNKHPYYLDLFVSSFIDDQMSDINMQVDNDGFTFLNTDENSNIGDKPFSFMFSTQVGVDQPSNKGPQLEQIPQLNGKIGERLTYGVDATDPENDELTFISSSPIITIDPATGIIDFVPTREDVGTHIAQIRVVDTESNSDEQYATITITGENNKPELYAQNQTIYLGEIFSYQPTVFDSDSTEFRFFIIKGPENAQIDENLGLITWFTNAIGNYEFIVGVNDSSNSVNAAFILEVLKIINNPPILHVEDKQVKVNEEFNYEPFIYDEDGDNLILKIESPSDAKVKNNIIKWLPKNIGTFKFIVNLSDSKNEVKAEFNVGVIQ